MLWLFGVSNSHCDLSVEGNLVAPLRVLKVERWGLHVDCWAGAYDEIGAVALDPGEHDLIFW